MGKIIRFVFQVKIWMVPNYRLQHILNHVNGNEKIEFIN